MNFLAKRISEHLDNHISLDQNLINLKRKLEMLDAVNVDNESVACEQLRRPGKKLKKEVDIWFKHVERINNEILNDLESKIGGSNLLSRGFLGSKVLKTIEEVEVLLKQGKSFGDLVINEPQMIGQVLSTTTLIGEDVKSFMEEIWAYLMDDGVPKIGVWGMGGMGKTTIMKLINNKLLKKIEKFDAVIWITVSKELNIAKLQDDIACAMKESPLKVYDATRRAGIIHQNLSKIGKYVLILDDLWDKLSLEEVGIPEPTIGRKLVITTRSLDVCHYLDCREVRVPTLSKQDASSLFLDKVGRDVWSDPVLSPTVEAVIEQCACLPLAVVTVASSMKGVRSIHEWRDALNELKRGAKGVKNLDEKVLQQLQFSYDRLENETLKQCFLYCALWPEDFDILKNELIELWIAEGLMEEIESVQAEIDRAYTILNKLINNCLLENTSKFGRSSVKLHDLVRDMALGIMSVKPQFLIRAGMQLKEIPNWQKWTKDLDKVSLMQNLGMKIPPQMLPPKCQMLTTLLLCSCNIKSIPECFFEQMHGLKVLDLSWNYIVCLPNSISDLVTLTALLLKGCNYLEKMPSLSKLQALKKLNLGGTSIRNLPCGIERLVKLKYLDLSNTFIKRVPDGILSKFSCLQHLVGCNPIEKCKTFVRGDEIGGLRNLEIFKWRFYDLKELSNYVQALYGQTQGPREYYIHVNGLAFYFSYQKCIELSCCQICKNGAKFPSDIQQLILSECSFEFCEELLFSQFIPMPHDTFSALTQITISACNNIKKLFSSDWARKNLQNLVDLAVTYCNGMEEIIASELELEEEGMDTSNTIKLAFPKLRVLTLWGLQNLKSIYSAKGVIGCDSLQTISILDCPKLKMIPLYLPMLEEDRPSPPASLQNIFIGRMQWENMGWDQPYARSVLEPFLMYWDEVHWQWIPGAEMPNNNQIIRLNG